MDLSKIKVGKRVAFISRKTAGTGRVTDIRRGETGDWVEIEGRITRARPNVKGDDWQSCVARPATVVVRPSQVSAV